MMGIQKQLCEHAWKPHPVKYRDTWPKDKKWQWETCKRCGMWRNIGPE